MLLNVMLVDFSFVYSVAKGQVELQLNQATIYP